jgi:hypothetical protein
VLTALDPADAAKRTGNLDVLEVLTKTKWVFDDVVAAVKRALADGQGESGEAGSK